MFVMVDQIEQPWLAELTSRRRWLLVFIVLRPLHRRPGRRLGPLDRPCRPLRRDRLRPRLPRHLAFRLLQVHSFSFLSLEDDGRSRMIAGSAKMATILTCLTTSRK